jgi:hypothetical protein
MDSVEKVNWLAHRWLVDLETYQYGRWLVHVGKVEGHRIAQATSREEFESWLSRERPICLARFIAARPALHPAVVLVTAGSYRLGRIPPELWCGYDVTPLLDLPPVTLLSAKARAMFPAWPAALIRVVHQDRLGSLGLRPAPDPRGPRLKAVA